MDFFLKEQRHLLIRRRGRGQLCTTQVKGTTLDKDEGRQTPKVLCKRQTEKHGGGTKKQNVLLGEMFGCFKQHAVCSQLNTKKELSYPSLRPDPTPAGSNSKGLLFKKKLKNKKNMLFLFMLNTNITA